MLHIVDTHVFNGTGAVPEILDVEVDHFDAQFFHVGYYVFRDFLGHALAVLDHFLQTHRAHDFTHIAFQHLGHQGDELILVHVEQGLGSAKKQSVVGRNFDVGHAIDADVDELVGGDGFRGFHVHLHDPQGDPVHPLKEGDAPTGLADEDAALTEAGDDVGCVWGALR